jgi:hypothetical protein
MYEPEKILKYLNINDKVRMPITNYRFSLVNFVLFGFLQLLCFLHFHILFQNVSFKDFLDRGLLFKREATEPNGSVMEDTLHSRFFSFFKFNETRKNLINHYMYSNRGLCKSQIYRDQLL